MSKELRRLLGIVNVVFFLANTGLFSLAVTQNSPIPAAVAIVGMLSAALGVWIGLFV